MTEPRVTIVVASRDRRAALLQSVPRHLALPERPAVVVVDNGSADGGPDALAAAHPAVRVLRAGRNLGAAGRNLGVEAARTPYVALTDDDAWWAPGALDRAAGLLDAHPRLAAVQAHVLVGPDERDDPTCLEMARSPLPAAPGVPGHPIISFIACATLVRRDAYLAVGGFHERLGIGGEESLLGWDLDAAGWSMAYVPEVRAHHHPDSGGERPGRREQGVRNGLWTTWLRRPARSALAHTAGELRRARRDPATRRGVVRALGGVPWVLRDRRVFPPQAEAKLRLLERADAA